MKCAKNKEHRGETNGLSVFCFNPTCSRYSILFLKYSWFISQNSLVFVIAILTLREREREKVWWNPMDRKNYFIWTKVKQERKYHAVLNFFECTKIDFTLLKVLFDTRLFHRDQSNQPSRSYTISYHVYPLFIHFSSQLQLLL